MRPIRTLIVDDERAARQELRRLLASFPEFFIIGEAKNADEALTMINQEKPDLLLLDIQMPGKSGFELLEELNSTPQVIFVTAFDKYALKAFEVSALDYLMKPVRTERFAKAIAQVLMKFNTDSTKQFFLKDGNKYHFITWSNVHLIESMDNYAKLHTGNQIICIKKSLTLLEKELDPQLFFRINRAQIINLQFVTQIKTNAAGRLLISSNNGELFEASDRQTVRFKNRTIL
ncbi:LytR/AlgR family response regulator transcription factor [Pedobacter duraquae]|uniref:LytTR family two component transcriptional regulator n=1 Tax=Pedobacter duraquae TaxID=425511 RepID=A0A4V3C3T9_9SPHI|nr:response regulator transcription factor [Pedobacter duraquae]TDO23358.1 LytTR family two component transcriptional regulator [Pedobacter duraquae]